jgi:hypothetical protein
MPVSYPHASRFSPRVAAWLRVSLYVGALAMALFLWSARAVYAETELALREMTQGLAAELGPELMGEPARFSINGQILHFAVAQSRLPVAEVLARFEASCHGAREPIGLELPEDNGKQATFVRALLAFTERLLVMRSEQPGEGHLLCFAQPPGRSGLAGMVQGVQEFAASGDLSRLGQLRHVSARAFPDGTTQVRTVWSEGSLALLSLFPVSGDAPGEDPRDVPRPSSARRVGSARIAGRPFGLHVYASREPPQALLSFYERALSARGWERVPTLPELEANGAARAQSSTGGDTLARAFTRDGRALTLGLRAASEGSVISLVDLGSVQRAVAY